MKKFIFLLLLVLAVVFYFNNSNAHPEPANAPLPLSGHAHNDYQHEHPLWDALHYGFGSIEVDVRLMGGTLFVAHDSEDIRPFKTLKSMYLNPLRELVKNNNGGVYQDGSGIILLIDIKSDAEDGWKALAALLPEYEEILSGRVGGKLEQGKVTIVVSGERDLNAMVAAEKALAMYDGRLVDLQKNPNVTIISLISAKWTEEFGWNGKDPMAEEDLEKLNRIVAKAHSQDRKVRFWDTDISDEVAQQRMWNLLLTAGVDFIGTDKLKDFKNFSYTDEAISSLNRSKDSGNQGDAPPH
jgi:glycerophosphoryl diester phosphodiesterase